MFCSKFLTRRGGRRIARRISRSKKQAEDNLKPEQRRDAKKRDQQKWHAAKGEPAKRQKRAAV
jgi:hypothetical protein